MPDFYVDDETGLMHRIEPAAEVAVSEFSDLLSVYEVRSTENEERYGEIRLVAANNETEAVQLTEGTFDYSDEAQSVKKTEMFAEHPPRIIDSIYLG